ncbi:short-chain dehydrogenase [Marmoricola endophyticus]|uniref:Short-chain dehydrogenase n=1 Tax=Marmoricola endophyticus TaxID=2040280 RepID=A0A917F7K2_9ACTN|nr:SDR family NAD(P)-dependent oxidoreductase [Marmoricola endophyticus]GGF51371.1 short-chain dehydrogenase [Marmoricola endophyticus]
MPSTILVVGASRGLGHALAAELVGRGWSVVGTVRDPGRRTPLHALADAHPGRVEVETLDINDAAQLDALHRRLGGRALDALFVNAGTTSHQDTPIGEVPLEAFVEVLVTNTLSPMRVVETLDDVVAADGLIGAMTSGQGSITNNTAGSREVYRASKAALNMSFRSYAARHPERPLLLLAPGWVRTDLGGSEGTYSLEETTPLLADLIEAKRDRPGLEYLDRFGATVPW